MISNTGSGPPVEVELTIRGSVAVLSIRGRLDAARVSDVRETIAQVPSQGHTLIVLDLSLLSWIDSSGVGALVTLYRQVEPVKGRVAAAALQRQPREIFRLLRLDSAFEVFETVDEGVAALSTAK